VATNGENMEGRHGGQFNLTKSQHLAGDDKKVGYTSLR